MKKFQDLILNKEVEDFWEDLIIADHIIPEMEDHLYIKYREMHSELTALTPEKTDNFGINLPPEIDNLNQETFIYKINDPIEVYSLSYITWEQVLGMTVEDEVLDLYSEEQIIAHVYSTLAEISWTSEGAIEEIEKLKKILELVKDTTKQRKKESWMELTQEEINNLDKEDWDVYLNKGCLCMARSRGECSCGAWQADDES